jgi:hypothetical protein
METSLISEDTERIGLSGRYFFIKIGSELASGEINECQNYFSIQK